MEFANHSPFPALAFYGVTQENQEFHGVVMRQTFTFAEGALDFDEEQSPLQMADQFHGEMNQSSMWAERDLCHHKPACDVIVNAIAHAPRGKPTRCFQVGLQVQPAQAGKPLINKCLEVSGPSWFRKRSAPVRPCGFLLRLASLGLFRLRPWVRTRSKKIQTLPLTYEHAFGGEAKVLITDAAAARVPKSQWLQGADPKHLRTHYVSTGEAKPLAWTVYDANPLGQGYAPKWHLRAARNPRVPAPQIQAAEAPFTPAQFMKALKNPPEGDQPPFRPEGLGIINKSWYPRRLLLGTLDESYCKTQQPLPTGFDFAYWNAAPADQQVPWLEGDERIILINLCRPDAPGTVIGKYGDTVLPLQLPGYLPFLMVHFANGQARFLRLHLDTVQIHPEQSRLVLVWRRAIPVEAAIRQIETLFLSKAELTTQIKARLAAAGKPSAPTPAGSRHG